MAEIAAGASALWSSLTGAGSTILGSAGGQAAVNAAINVGTAAIAAKALAPKAPKAPGAVPIPDQTAVDAARRRSAIAQMQRRGRDSTILSQTEEDTLG